MIELVKPVGPIQFLKPWIDLRNEKINGILYKPNIMEVQYKSIL